MPVPGLSAALLIVHGARATRLAAYCASVALLVALLLSGSAPAAQAEAPVTMQVSAGFDGRGRLGHWVPVVVDVQNDGPDLVGELQVVEAGPAAAGPVGYSSHYVAEVVLPKGARKRLTLYVPLSGGDALPVRLAAGGKTLAELDASVKLVGEGDLLAGILSRKPGALAGLGALQLLGGGQQVVLSRLQPPDLPPAPESLDNFAFLALVDFESADLSAEQVAALEAWVAGGGTLFVGAGPEWRRTLAGLPPGLRPVDVQGTVELEELPAVADLAGAPAPKGSVVAAQGGVRAGRPIVTQDGIPLVVQAPVGAGSVVFLAFDSSLEPVASWAGGLALWRELLGRALPARMLVPQAQGRPPGVYWRTGGGMAGALSNLPALDLPPTELLLGLLGSYVLLVGPLNYLLLRRLRRLAFAWVTVPAFALLFGAGTYVTALQGKGGTVLTHTISVVHLSPGAAAQRVQSYIGLFAPSETSYRLTVASGGLVSALGSPYRPASAAADAPAGLRIRREVERSVVDLVGMEMWSMRGIAVEERRADLGAVAADLRVQDGKLAGTVTNHTGWALRDAVLIAGGSFQRLGDLAVGATAAVDLSLASPPPSGSGWPPVFYQAYAPPTPTPVAPRSTASPASAPAPTSPLAEREAMRRQQILGELFNANPDGRLDEPILLIGWSESSPVAFAVEGQAPRTVQSTVVVAPLRPAFGDTFQLPAGFIPAKVVGGNQNNLSWGPSGLQLAGGSLTVQFALPADVAVDELALEISVSGGQPGAAPLDVQLYNWQARRWDDVAPAATQAPATAGATPGVIAVAPGRLPTAARPPPPAGASPPQRYLVLRQGAATVAPYVGPDGLLRVKLGEIGQNVAGIGIPALALKGRAGG